MKKKIRFIEMIILNKKMFYELKNWILLYFLKIIIMKERKYNELKYIKKYYI